MYFTKLTTQLQAFDKALLKKLNSYIHSPYFKVPVSAKAFFDYLQKQYPTFNEKNLDPKVITGKVPVLINANKQAKAGSDLQKAIDHFLALENLEHTGNWRNLNLLQSQKRLGLNNAFETTIVKAVCDIHNSQEKDIDYFYELHLLTEIKYNGFDARLKRNLGNDLKPITETLDTYYALKKIRYHCELINRHQVLGAVYHAENIPALLNSIAAYSNPQYPYVFLFTNVYRMMAAPTFDQAEVYYNTLYRFIVAARYKVLPQGVKECITYLVNYSLYWNNLGYEKAGSHALFWYGILLQYNLLPEKEKLQPSDYRNITALSIINKKDAAWLKNFIDVNQVYLPPEHRDTNYAFAQGQYYCYTGEYDKAMPVFQQALAKDEPIFNMIVKSSQFKCIYEGKLQNKEVLFDFLLAWQRQLHRNAPSLHHLKPVFAKVINYSIKLLQANDKVSKNKVMLNLQKEAFFAGKYWLIEQLKK